MFLDSHPDNMEPSILYRKRLSPRFFNVILATWDRAYSGNKIIIKILPCHLCNIGIMHGHETKLWKGFYTVILATWDRTLSSNKIINKLLRCHPSNMRSSIIMKQHYQKVSALSFWKHGIEHCHETKLSPNFCIVILAICNRALSWNNIIKMFLYCKSWQHGIKHSMEKEIITKLLQCYSCNIGSSILPKQHYHQASAMSSWQHGIEYCHETKLWLSFNSYKKANKSFPFFHIKPSYKLQNKF